MTDGSRGGSRASTKTNPSENYNRHHSQSIIKHYHVFYFTRTQVVILNFTILITYNFTFPFLLKYTSFCNYISVGDCDRDILF